jgi:hypothetical protein
MHALFPLALAAVLSAAPAPDESAGPRATIDKAVQAVGGEAKLAGARTCTQRVTGKFNGPKGSIAFTAEWVVNFPDQVRQTADCESDGKTFRAIKVIAGDKGWVRINDLVEELPKSALAEARDDLYAAWVATLLPLKEKEYTLSPLPESKVGDRPAVGVKVTHADRPDVALFFDKEKGWLLRSEFTTKVADKPVKTEVVYEDYRDTDGLQRPRKTTLRRDGKVLVESEVSEFKPLDKADAKLFERP